MKQRIVIRAQRYVTCDQKDFERRNTTVFRTNIYRRSLHIIARESANCSSISPFRRYYPRSVVSYILIVTTISTDKFSPKLKYKYNNNNNRFDHPLYTHNNSLLLKFSFLGHRVHRSNLSKQLQEALIRP